MEIFLRKAHRILKLNLGAFFSRKCLKIGVRIINSKSFEFSVATSLFSQSSEMGTLSFYLKPKFLGLLKLINSMNWLIVFFSLINLSLCIYEDQIGKFDWRQTYVGRIKLAQFDTSSTAKRIIVATEENVLAALNLKTGSIVWRQVLETASAGNIQALYLTPSDQAVSISGNNPYLVRGWDSATGVLMWEWALTLQDDERADFSEWWVSDNRLLHLLPVFRSHLEVTWYNVVTGHNSGVSSKLPAAWSNEGCIFTAPFYTCVSGESGKQLIMSLNISSDVVQLISKPLSDVIGEHTEATLRPLDGNSIMPGFVVDDSKIVVMKESKFHPLIVVLGDPSASVTIIDSVQGHIVLQTWSDDDMGFSLTSHSATTGLEFPDIDASERGSIKLEPEISAAMCTRLRDQLACRIFITTADEASYLLQQGGKVLWTREESLANVVAAEFVDLPVSDLDAAIESEFDQKEGSIWGAFTRRLQTQIQQLHTLLFEDTSKRNGPQPLVRDYFNLHKLIILVTDVGKIFGMDNLSGEILWKRYEANFDTENVVIFTRRTARHPPLDAYITIVGKHEETGKGMLISVEPVSGRLVGERVLRLPAPLLQAALLPRAGADRLHALLLLHQDQNVQVLPAYDAPLVENMFMYVAEKNTARVQGYALKYDGEEVIAEKIWSLNLGGHASSGHRIVTAVGKPASEKVHSAGKVLGDRSVLYKYSNPNLVLFVTEGPDALHKDVVVGTCVDVVSGAVVCAQAHRRARALPLAVHADNFMAYLYHNDKHRRTEIATLELYEGKQRWIPAGGAFSSLSMDRAPLVERQAYILPAAPTAAAITNTERSLTDKHVLLALSTGAIIELPWAYLEPRRPVSPTAEQREEGLLGYAPELPLPAEAVVNYNRSLHRVRRIYTAPAALESTSLVLATGLDLYYTRVAPSKTFDLLKEDFDYSLITIVLAGLIVATYSTKYFASRKLLKLAWK